jgi:two-component system sensor histidine kinase TctE
MQLAALSSGLRRRLLLLLMLPLSLLACINTWFDYRSADNAALQQDRQLLQLVPLLADSVVAPGKNSDSAPVMLLAPAIEEFLKDRTGLSAYGISNLEGQIVMGDDWLTGLPPTTNEPEFSSEEEKGVTYRIVSQRMQTAGGPLVVRLADGSDPRQQWLNQVLKKVLLPNLVLMVLAFFVINWAVQRALQPLLQLKIAVEKRSPSDLSAVDVALAPEEVRPLVQSLNRLLALVNAQAESQRRFVADAAHQLRTPLAALQSQIEAWAQMVGHPHGASDSHHENQSNQAVALENKAQGALVLDSNQIFRLRDAARRTTQLANQLLALSRVDARNPASQPREHVDLKALCNDLLEANLDRATRQGIDLGLEVQALRVWGHAWLLRELLSNLLDNALKYTPSGGLVTLRCGHRAEDRAPMLEVEDDGPGVPADDWPRVLERFYRVPGTAVDGNGLGLAIADEIARVHSGQLLVGCGLGGRGARFTLLLLCENEISPSQA